MKASIDHVRIADIHGGSDTRPGTAILAFRNATVSVRDTVISDSESGMRVATEGILFAENSMITGCLTGVYVEGGVARLSNDVVTANQAGWRINGFAFLETFGNNEVRGNTLADISNSGTITLLAQN